ncbi:hypothetical protein BDV95DRAFT_602761 [Massariosphaeria phaeospora]|uniref:Uncharacterized protein n=1 Tax=Massariosphaeria phaeospora TaxID=100035 RepID=A0A7C8MHA2_9PLEO|nr:hypothetical protein BDV95DRAFT_602761 [Massariosphaeria phaeospora]
MAQTQHTQAARRGLQLGRPASSPAIATGPKATVRSTLYLTLPVAVAGAALRNVSARTTVDVDMDMHASAAHACPAASTMAPPGSSPAAGRLGTCCNWQTCKPANLQTCKPASAGPCERPQPQVPPAQRSTLRSPTANRQPPAAARSAMRYLAAVATPAVALPCALLESPSSRP